MSFEDQSGELTIIIERYLLLKEQGLTMPVDQLCKDSPHLVDAVSRELQALGKIDQVLDSHTEQPTVSPLLGTRKGIATTTASYQIEKLHAHGGSSEVYVAFDERLNRRLAIKFLRPETENLQNYRARLRREAEVTSQLSHPGVVSIHSIGEDQRGMPFYTMRFVEGDSLAVAIEEFHSGSGNQRDVFYTASARRLLNHFRDICQTIAFAHDKGVVHRDLKPANVVIGSFGETYVIDWGLARQMDGDKNQDDNLFDDPEPANAKDSIESPRLTQIGSTLGSPAFMSPEQASGHEAAVPSDIFNLGATLYMILTGRPPYSDTSLLQTLESAEKATCPGPRLENRNVPRSLDAVCKKAMNRIPDLRYESADQLADEIDRFLADEPVQAMNEPWMEKTLRWVKRRRTLVTTLATSAVVAMVLLAIGNALLLERNRELALRESNAVKLKEETRDALDVANERLYSQRIALAHAEYVKNNPHRALQILNECPVELRQWEWHHLNWLITRHQPWRQARGDGQMVGGLAVSPDSSLVAFGDSKGNIHLWDFQNDRIVQRLSDNLSIRSIDFSPDGKRIVVGGTVLDGSNTRSGIHLWDIESSTRLTGRNSNTVAFTSVEYSADGTLIVTGSVNGGIRIRDAKTLVPVTRINDAHRGEIGKVVFVGNTHRILSCGKEDGLVKSWDSQGNQTFETAAHAGGVTDLILGDALIATAGNDMLVKVWERKEDVTRTFTDSRPSNLVGHTDRIQTVCLSPDERYLVSAGLDRNIRFWDLRSNEEIEIVRQHSSHIRHVIFDSTGTYLFSSGDDNRVNAWKVSALTRPVPRGQSVAFSGGSNNLISAGKDKLEIWSTPGNKPVARITAHPSALNRVISCRKRNVMAGLYSNGSVVLWNAENGNPIHTLPSAGSTAFSGAFSNDGSRLFVGHRLGKINVWDVSKGELIQSRETPNSVFRIEISNDGSRLLTGHMNGTLRIWSAPDLTLIKTIQAHDGALLDMAIHPNRDEVATTGKSGEIRIWDIQTAKQKMEMQVGASWLNCMCYTPDGNRLVSGSEHTITFWDSITGKEVLSFSANRCVHSMAFSADGRFFAVTGEDPRVRLWQGKSIR